MPLDFQLGLTAATRVNITYRGLPEPDTWTYVPYSSVKQAGDGSAKGFGFPTFTWVWESLGQWEVNVLLGFFGASDASVQMYVRTHSDVGGGPPSVVTGTAIMDRPVDGSGKTMISETRRPSYNNVTLTFRHFEAA